MSWLHLAEMNFLNLITERPKLFVSSAFELRLSSFGLNCWCELPMPYWMVYYALKRGEKTLWEKGFYQ